MKTMRQISAFFLAIVMALSLAACGGSESTVVLRGDLTDDMDGIPSTDTWTLTAKGDVIQTMKEVVEYDLSDYDDETQELFTSMFVSILEASKGIDGLTCITRMTDGVYTIELTVDCTGDAVKKAAEAGILTVDDSNADFYSLKRTQSSLEQQGYKVVE